MARCPHCQASLPEAATFCAACGRRIEGWRAPPRASDGEPAAPLPGGEEPTRHLAPTPSLLRAAAIGRENRSKKAAATPATKSAPTASSSRGPQASGPVETDSALLRSVRSGRVPLALALLAVGFTAAASAFFLVRRRALPPASNASVTAAPVKSPSPAPSLSPVTKTTATKTAFAPSALKPPHHAPAPHRLAAMTIPTRERHPRAGRGHVAHDRTGLPMKIVNTDSRAQPLAAKSPPVEAARLAPAAPAEITAAPPTAPAPLTDEELKREAQASIDADGVRFVVKAHLPQVHACYERAFKESSPGGRVEIGFAIDAQGRAIRIRTEVNTTDSAPLARCLEQRVKEWQFPHPVGGDYDLVYPFVFSAGS